MNWNKHYHVNKTEETLPTHFQNNMGLFLRFYIFSIIFLYVNPEQNDKYYQWLYLFEEAGGISVKVLFSGDKIDIFICQQR